jgi:cobalt-zinc-cadmium efflux system outer membrane protein
LKDRYIFLLPLFLAAAITLPGRAQQSGESPASQAGSQLQRLTLAAALDLAEKQNLDLVAARAQRAVSQAGVQIAGERPNPTVSFGATRDTPHESLFMDQPIEIGPKRERRIELARQQGALAEIDIATLERQTRQNVRNAYFGLAFARGSTAQQADALKLAERLQDIADARFQAGDIPQLEVTQADLERARAQADLQVAQQEESVALSDLNALLNAPAAENWDLGDAFNLLPPAMTLDDLQARTSNSNAEIARISQEEKVEQSHKSLLDAERIPNLGIEFGADFNSPTDFEIGGRGQLSMELPIFSRNQGEIAQSTANERALQSELEATRRAVAARVGSAYFDLEARRTEVQLYRDTLLPSSRQLEEMTEESYRAGKANILTVLDAQHDVQQAERDYLSSLLAMQAAFAQLEEAVGAPLD